MVSAVKVFCRGATKEIALKASKQLTFTQGETAFSSVPFFFLNLRILRIV
jgi:hypothetical protein